MPCLVFYIGVGLVTLYIRLYGCYRSVVIASRCFICDFITAKINVEGQGRGNRKIFNLYIVATGCL